MKYIKLKKLIFDYNSSIDYNPFGGGFKPKGYWTLNKQKLINLILITSVIIILCLQIF